LVAATGTTAAATATAAEDDDVVDLATLEDKMAEEEGIL
jgi:hypothetical protein